MILPLSWHFWEYKSLNPRNLTNTAILHAYSNNTIHSSSQSGASLNCFSPPLQAYLSQAQWFLISYHNDGLYYTSTWYLHLSQAHLDILPSKIAKPTHSQLSIHEYQYCLFIQDEAHFNINRWNISPTISHSPNTSSMTFH